MTKNEVALRDKLITDMARQGLPVATIPYNIGLYYTATVLNAHVSHDLGYLVWTDKTMFKAYQQIVSGTADQILMDAADRHSKAVESLFGKALGDDARTSITNELAAASQTLRVMAALCVGGQP